MTTVSVTTMKSSGSVRRSGNISLDTWLDRHADKQIGTGEYRQPFTNTLVKWYQCSDATARYELRIYQ